MIGDIGEHETPPDFEPSYVEARPELKALLATAPERAHAAMVYIYRQGVAKAAAEATAKASLSTQELVALAATGDETVAQILAVREQAAPKATQSGFAKAELARLAAQAGVSMEDIAKYGGAGAARAG